MPNFGVVDHAAWEGVQVMYSRSALVGVLLFVCALALSGCAGDVPPTASSRSTAPSAAAPPEASARPATPAPDLGDAAGGIGELSSYVLDIVVHASDQDVQSMSVTAVRDPVNATHYVFGDIELITIEGEGAWIRQAGTWIEAPGGADAFQATFDALAPENLVDAYSLAPLGGELVDAGIEQTNGVETRHYHLDASGATGTAPAGFPADGSIDVRIATNGGYLVSMQYGGTDPETGTRVEVSIEVTRANDPSIAIEAPI